MLPTALSAGGITSLTHYSSAKWLKVTGTWGKVIICHIWTEPLNESVLLPVISLCHKRRVVQIETALYPWFWNGKTWEIEWWTESSGAEAAKDDRDTQIQCGWKINSAVVSY